MDKKRAMIEKLKEVSDNVEGENAEISERDVDSLSKVRGAGYAGDSDFPANYAAIQIKK